MPDLTFDTLADLHTLMTRTAGLRRGNTAYVTPPQPAAGSGLAYSVPSDWWQRLMGVYGVLTTSATAQNRQLNLVIATADGAVIDETPLVSTAFASQSIAFAGGLDGPSPPAISTGLTAYGTVTSPGAFASVASIAGVQPGVYTVNWTPALAGTLAAGTDNDNFRLVIALSFITRGVNAAAAGTYPQPPVAGLMPSASTISVQTQAAGTVGSIYSCTISATPVGAYPVQALLPDLILKSQWQVQLQAVNFAAGDQLSQVGLLFERYPSNWADGALGSDLERLVREYLRRDEPSQYGL